MKIEERELHYGRDEPLLAWRLFRVRADGDGVVLSSPMYHDPAHPPWPAVESVAFCSEGHSAPAPGCRCGIYGAIPGTLDSLPGYLFDTAYEEDPFAYAEIACAGRVFVDMRGIRVERARIVRLAVPEPTVERVLAERYAVPVGGLEEVPEWVTRNERDQGPPGGDTSLALDLSKLDLWRSPA
jgi:hypothetical protein